ncbi:MAG: acyl-CoA thioesterase [Candidatus Limnocylindrales bacterium]
MSRATPPEGAFRYVHPVEVRFRDTDAMGHVNNAVYLTYFETARAGYYRALTGRVFDLVAGTEDSMIMAHCHIEYRSPAFFGDVLLVACRPGWVSRSSFSLEYRITAAVDSTRGAGRLIADGESIQVMYDYAGAHSMLMPEGLLRALEAYEGHPIRPRPTD